MTLDLSLSPLNSDSFGFLYFEGLLLGVQMYLRLSCLVKLTLLSLCNIYLCPWQCNCLCFEVNFIICVCVCV